MNPGLRQICAAVAMLNIVLIGCGNKTTPQESNNQQPVVNRTLADQAAPMKKSSEGALKKRAEIYFHSMLRETGIDFRHVSGNSAEKAFPAANGSGLAAFDADMDGYVDLYFGNGAQFPVDSERDSSFDKFYRNLGEWRFSEATALAGFRNPNYTTGVEYGDFNGDGFPDVYTTSVGRNQLYLNLGDGTFFDVSASSRTDDPRWATSAAFTDIDNDGLLDLYVCNYGQWTFETNQYCGDKARGIRMFCSPTMVPSEDDVLYRNHGDGTFEDYSEASGIRVRNGRGQGVIALELNDDARTELYVSNDINPNFLFLGDGKGHFTEVGELSGTAFDHQGQAQAGMGLAAGDVDRNGHFDLFVTNYQNEHNALYENLGNGIFLETGITRIPEGSLPYVGWGTALEDFDLDGWLDLIVTNGHTDENLAELGKEGAYLQPPGLWKNRNGRFRLLEDDRGPYFEELHNGRGLVVADLDHDGDSDVVIGHQDDHPGVLRNDSVDTPSEKMIWLRLVDRSCNRNAIGAVIEQLHVDLPVRRTISGGGSYASASDRRVVIAIDKAAAAALRITWPDGTSSLIDGLQAGEGFVIVRPPDSGSPVRVVRIKDP